MEYYYVHYEYEAFFLFLGKLLERKKKPKWYQKSLLHNCAVIDLILCVHIVIKWLNSLDF